MRKNDAMTATVPSEKPADNSADLPGDELSATEPATRLTPEQFWQYVADLGGRAEPEGFAALIETLAQLRSAAICSFADHLATALYALDSRDRMAQPIRDTADGPDSPAFPLSKEVFLYARLAVVVAGRETWQRVVDDPAAMAGTWDLGAEELLYVAPAAFAQRTGSDWTHRTELDHTTGSNADGWA